MVRKLTAVALVVLLSASLVAAGETDKKVTKLTEDNASTTVKVSVGTTLEITLKENASTGYTWGPGTYDEKILKFKGKTTIPPKTQMMGAPGKMTMTFEVIGPGKTVLKVLSRRNPEKSGASGKTYRVTVEAAAK